jgi:hypothetical protein
VLHFPPISFFLFDQRENVRRRVPNSVVLPNAKKIIIFVSNSELEQAKYPDQSQWQKKETNVASLKHAVFTKYCCGNKGSSLQNKYVLDIITNRPSPILQDHCVKIESDIDPPTVSDESVCLEER